MLRDEAEKPWREAKKTLGKVGIREHSHLLSTQKALHGAPRAASMGVSNRPTEHQEQLPRASATASTEHQEPFPEREKRENSYNALYKME